MYLYSVPTSPALFLVKTIKKKFSCFVIAEQNYSRKCKGARLITPCNISPNNIFPPNAEA
jgi:hypothetical protein